MALLLWVAVLLSLRTFSIIPSSIGDELKKRSSRDSIAESDTVQRDIQRFITDEVVGRRSALALRMVVRWGRRRNSIVAACNGKYPGVIWCWWF